MNTVIIIRIICFLNYVVMTLSQGTSTACTGCSDVCCLIPPSTALEFPCYQGSPDDASFDYETDPSLQDGTTWMCDTCDTYGFSQYLRNDPVYVNLELWNYTGIFPDTCNTTTATSDCNGSKNKDDDDDDYDGLSGREIGLIAANIIQFIIILVLLIRLFVASSGNKNSSGTRQSLLQLSEQNN